MTFDTFIWSLSAMACSSVVLIELIKWQALEVRVDATDALINWKEANPGSVPSDYSYSRELVMNLFDAYLYYIFWNKTEDGFDHAIFILSLLEITNGPDDPNRKTKRHKQNPRLTAGVSSITTKYPTEL